METEGLESRHLPHLHLLAILSSGEIINGGVSLIGEGSKSYLKCGLRKKYEFEGLEVSGSGDGGGVNRDIFVGKPEGERW